MKLPSVYGVLEGEGGWVMFREENSGIKCCYRGCAQGGRVLDMVRLGLHRFLHLVSSCIGSPVDGKGAKHACGFHILVLFTECFYRGI